jgi:hypothetical protein
VVPSGFDRYQQLVLTRELRQICRHVRIIRVGTAIPTHRQQLFVKSELDRRTRVGDGKIIRVKREQAHEHGSAGARALCDSLDPRFGIPARNDRFDCRVNRQLRLETTVSMVIMARREPHDRRDDVSISCAALTVTRLPFVAVKTHCELVQQRIHKF